MFAQVRIRNSSISFRYLNIYLPSQERVHVIELLHEIFFLLSALAIVPSNQKPWRRIDWSHQLAHQTCGENFEGSVAGGATSTSGQDFDGRLTFTCFRNLPPELRHKIWKEAASVPRIVDLWAVQNCTDECQALCESEHVNGPYTYKTHVHFNPAILHTSKEAGEIGLRVYKPEFGDEFHRTGDETIVRASHPGKIYINWACDVIFPVPTEHYGQDPNWLFWRRDVWDESRFLGQYGFDLSDRMKSIAVNVSSVCQILDLLKYGELNDIYIFRRHQSLGDSFLYYEDCQTFELWDVTEDVELQLRLGNHVDVHVEKFWCAGAAIENSIEIRRSPIVIKHLGALPEAWKPPRIRFMRMEAQLEADARGGIRLAKVPSKHVQSVERDE